MQLSFHSNQNLHGTSRVSLVKATKPKANPATNEVRDIKVAITVARLLS